MKKRSPNLSAKKFIFLGEGWVWGALANLAWLGVLLWHSHRGIPLSALVWAKGFLLLSTAAAVFSLAPRRGFSLLGIFPLLWLAASSFQWDLCSPGNGGSWVWLVLFLAGEAVILVLTDGKKILFLLAPLWIALAWFFPASLLLPLSFLTAFSGRFKRSAWVRWGGAAMVLVLFVLFGGWRSFRWDWFGLYSLLVSDRFIAFFLLGWLGVLGFPKKGRYRHAGMPLFWLAAGFLFWPGILAFPQEVEMMKWVLVFFAGFGLEALRETILDPTWHGRAVWAALGLALFGGVL